MIPDNDKVRFTKTPDEYSKEWIKSYKNKNINDKYGIWKKLTKIDKEDGTFDCKNEWLWEYFAETNYSELTKEDFEKSVKSFVMNQLKHLELEELSSNNIECNEV